MVSLPLLALGSLLPASPQNTSHPQERFKQLASAVEQAEKRQDYVKAAELYRELVRLDPRNPELHRRLGLVSYMSGRYPDAISAFEQAAKLDPVAPGTQLYLGISYYRMNRFADAIEALRQAPELDDPKNHLAQYWLGASYRAEKKFVVAIPFLESARDRAPRDLDVLTSLARAYAEYSAELLSDLVEKNPSSPAARLVRAEDVVAAADAAVEQIDQALSEEPSFVGAHLLKAQILGTQKRVDESVEACIQELKVDPFSYEAHLRLAAYHLDTGDPKKAEEHVALLTKLRPRDPDVQALSRSTASSRQEAGSGVHRCLWGGQAPAAFERGTGPLWDSAQGRFADVAQFWKTKLDNKPQDASAAYFLAKTYAELSAQTAQELLELNPNSSQARVLRGEAYEKGARTDFEKALAEYQEAAKLAASNPGVQYAIGRVLWKMNRFDEAIHHLENELRQNPSHGSAHLLLGKIFLSRRENAEAIQHLEQALQAQPAWPEAQRDLGRALVTEGRYKEGIEQYNSILARDPNDASVHALLAIAYRSAGKLEEARVAAEKARELKSRRLP